MKKTQTKQVEKKETVTKQVSQNPESRRVFLKKIWAGLGILASVEFVAVIFGFLFSGKGDKNVYTPKQLIEAGPVNSFQPNSVTPFRGGRFYLTRLEDGGFIALSPAVTAELFGLVGLGSILGAMYTAAGIGGLIGPPLAGYLIDSTGSYSPAIVTAMIFGFIAFLFLIPITRYMRNQLQ